MSTVRSVVVFVSLGLTSLLLACGDDGTGPSGPASIQVSAPATTLVIGETTQLTARVLSSGGSVLTGHSPTWTSSNPAVLTVDGSGLVTAMGPGIARIDAKVDQVTGSVSITARAPDCDATTTGGSIAAGAEVEGVLDLGDCFFLDGPHTDGFTFEITEATVVEAVLTSGDFDAVLVVTTLDMEILAVNDDAGATTDSRLVSYLEAGDYVLWVSSFDDALGSYDLTYDTGTRELCSEPLATLGVGDAFDGELGLGTCFSTLAGVADPYAFETAEVVTVRMDLTSDDFDTVVAVSDADGQLIDFNDDFDGTNSRLVLTLQPGTYTVWAASYTAVDQGDYAISLAGAAAAPLRAPISGDLSGPGPVGAWLAAGTKKVR